MSPIGECGYRRRDSCLRRNGNAFLPKAKKHSHERPPPSSILAKAGISFSRQREFSAKRNIAMVACRRMRLRRRDSGFRRNGSVGEYFLPPAACGGGVKNRKANFWGVENLPPTPNKKNHPQARRAKNSASINTGLPVARFPGVHAVPAISKCAHAGQSEKCERNAAAVIAPPGRPPIFAKSA